MGWLKLSKNIAVLDIGTTGVRILAAKVNEGGLLLPKQPFRAGV